MECHSLLLTCSSLLAPPHLPPFHAINTPFWLSTTSTSPSPSPPPPCNLHYLLLLSLRSTKGWVGGSLENMKLPFAVLLLVALLVINSCLLPPAMAGSGFCDSKCAERCSKAGVQDRCFKYCGICCRDCNCVPSGTYGNKHECPCYRDKKNSKGKPKCP